MQLLPSNIAIIEIVIVVALAAVAIVALVLTIQLKARVANLENALNDERRRVAEVHTFLERISRTNITQPDADMGLGAAPFGAQPMAPMGQQQPMVPDYGSYGAMGADASRRVAQSMPFPTAAQGYDPQAMRMPEQPSAQQQALEYAKYQERMQAHADQMQQQAMMPMQPGGRPQRQTQPVPPR